MNYSLQPRSRPLALPGKDWREFLVKLLDCGRSRALVGSGSLFRPHYLAVFALILVFSLFARPAQAVLISPSQSFGVDHFDGSGSQVGSGYTVGSFPPSPWTVDAPN